MSILLEDVNLTLGDGDEEVVALDHVTFGVADGELAAVVGPSGSGKSSLLAVAGALLRPTSGKVVVDGIDLAAISDKERTSMRRDKIGFVFQSSNLVPSLTATEQLQLIAHLEGMRPRQSRRRALELLDAVGMSHRADRRPHQLSGGERQRVGIARALMARPAVLLVDEPTSALDHERGAEIVQLLARESHENDVATVMVTHDTAMLDWVDSVHRMDDGRLSPAAPAMASGAASN
jgi:putative ABC transport system ATP-binding protein